MRKDRERDRRLDDFFDRLDMADATREDMKIDGYEAHLLRHYLAECYRDGEGGFYF